MATSDKRPQPAFGRPNESSPIVVSPLLSGHQALDTLSLALFQEHDEGKYSPKIGYNRLWTSNAAPFMCLFQNKVIFWLKIMIMLCLFKMKLYLAANL